MEILIECPVCKAQTFENFIKCKDFTVSQELFQIVNCTACGFKFTNPRPGPIEIGKYYESSDYISHSNSSKGIINKIYQVVRKRAINGKIHLINSEVGKSEKSILDIGCGTGEFLAACKSQGWKTKGIEPNDSARSQGINNFGLDVQKEEVLASLTERFEIISMWHVLEHVHLLRTRVKQLYSLLNDRGKAIIAVPNYTSADAEMYKEHWAAYDVPRHLYHFSPDLIKRLFKEEGLTHIKSLPMVYDSFYVSMLSEKYKSGSNNFFSAFRNGFMSNQKAGNNPERYSSVIYIFQKD